MNKWISVKDELPDYGVDVIIADSRRMLISNLVAIESTKEGQIIRWFVGNVEIQTITGFTHWMPLPEPPKE